MKSVFFVEMSAPHWLEAAARLREGGVAVSLWTGWFRIAGEVKARFPETAFHDTFLARIGLDPQARRPTNGPFDRACQDVWLTEAQIVYDMMNRFDYSRDQSFVERSTLFYEHLVYWRGILIKYEPDLVVFPAPPHVVYDYILLALCRATGVRTLMFEEATVYPPYSLAMRDYREGSAVLTSAASKHLAVSESTMDIIRKLRSDYQSAKPAREVLAQEDMKRAMEAGLAEQLRRAATVKSIDLAHKGTYEVNEKIVNTSSAYKEKGKSLRSSFLGPFANSRYMEHVVDNHKTTDELRAFYHDHSTQLSSIDRPFVYVPLAGQPERTSNPQAGVFANQLLMVNAIAHSVPDGWRVAVKEHPNQFHPNFAVNMCRDLGYYESLLQTPNVVLLPTQTDPFSAIDKSDAVATTGGTSAVEAAVRNKPSMLFGDAWYRDCPGVFRVSALEDARRFFQQLPTVTVDEIDVARYLESIKEVCFHGIADYPPADYPMDPGRNVENLVGLVMSSLDSAQTCQ